MAGQSWQWDGVRFEVLHPTPAHYGRGLKPNDLIIKLDDTPIKGMSLNDAVKRMRGKPKTAIRLTVVRKGEDKPLHRGLLLRLAEVEGAVGGERIKLAAPRPDDFATVVKRLAKGP